MLSSKVLSCLRYIQSEQSACPSQVMLQARCLSQIISYRGHDYNTLVVRSYYIKYQGIIMHKIYPVRADSVRQTTFSLYG